MGIGAADFTGDGIGDLFVTNSRDQLHAAVRGVAAGGPLFADARPDFASAFDTRLAGWGASWVDLDNDGRLELVVANGAIPVTSLRRDAQRLQVLANAAPRGAVPRYEDVAGLVGLPRTLVRNGRGLAAADFDNDGRVDVAVNSIGGKLMLLRTTGSSGHWLTVALDRFSPGAVVSVSTEDGSRIREVQAGSSYLSSEDPRVHFGLGDATTVREVRVTFPDGRVVVRRNVGVDRLLTVGS
jgi:hypothetical protein